MPATRAIPQVIGATENVLRALLHKALAGTAIDGYEEWVCLIAHETSGGRAGDGSRASGPIEPAGSDAAQSRLHDAGLLDDAGGLTSTGREQLRIGRELVSTMTRALTTGIGDAQRQATLQTLDTIRERAESLLGD